MASVSDFPRIIREVIEHYAQFKPSHGEIETEVVIDAASGHYQLLHSGWSGYRRIHGSVIHIDLRGDRVVIQHDGTEDGIAYELVERGIPAEHIVLAYKHPETRAETGFAVV